jgi:hypothetical protein
MKHLFLFSFLVILVASCKKDDVVAEEIDFGYDYYPGDVGRYVVYNCDSTVWVDLGQDTEFYKFQIKEIIDSAFSDNQGRPALRIARYKKWIKYDDTTVTVDTSAWYLQDIWWANKTTTTAEVVEENNRYIKLSFPVVEDNTWNGNSQNTMSAWDYEYTAVDVPYTIGTLSFPQTLHVKQYNSAGNPLFYKNYFEKYARGVGMIYKEITDYTWEQNNGTILTGTISVGLKYKMQAIQYGK